MDRKLTIYIIMGSTRPQRRSEVVARWVYKQALERSGWQTELIDLRNWPLPFYNEVAGVWDLKGKFSTDLAVRWGKKLAAADGFIFVTPEYNHGYPAVLKNALDYAYTEWDKKPAAFVAYGGIAAGARSVEQLRQVIVELGMVSVREAVYFPMIREAFDEAGRPKDASYPAKIRPLFDSLEWWALALQSARLRG